MTSLSFTVYGPPVAKERPRLTKNGRAFTPKRTRQYESLVGDVAFEAVTAAGWDPVVGKYAVEMHVYRQTRRGDLDNYIKILDGVNGVVWPDDSMVTEIHAFMYEDKANPRIEITVQRLT